MFAGRSRLIGSRPYNSVSVVAKSKKPKGIEVIALFSNPLQRGDGWQTQATAPGVSLTQGPWLYRGKTLTQLTSLQRVDKSRSKHTKSPAMRIAEDGGGSMCLRGMGMVIRRRPYNSMSAVVKSNKPAGIAVTALFSTSLQRGGGW